MLTLTADELEHRAAALMERLHHALPDTVHISIMKDTSQVGGGALPSQHLPTTAIALSSPAISVMELERGLREYVPPVIARIQKDQLLIDLRTVQRHEEPILEMALAAVIAPMI